MAKGQMKGNKEAKKPKADKPKSGGSAYKLSKASGGQAISTPSKKKWSASKSPLYHGLLAPLAHGRRCLAEKSRQTLNDPIALPISMARSVHDRVQGVGAREWGIIRETVYIATLFPIGEDETIKRSVNLAALTDDKAKEKGLGLDQAATHRRVHVCRCDKRRPSHHDSAAEAGVLVFEGLSASRIIPLAPNFSPE
jgi:hypothetical protein